MSDANERSPIRLTPEAKTRLVGLEADIKQAEHLIDVMDEMDMDVSQLRSELEHHKKIREVLLREFTD